MWRNTNGSDERNNNGVLKNGIHSFAPNEQTPLVRSASNVSAVSTVSIMPLPGMRVRSHAIGKDGTMRSCKSKEALAGARRDQGHFWIDIDADERDSEELRDWLDQLKLSPFLLSRLAEPPQTWNSQVLPFPDTILAVIRILPQDIYADETPHLAALCIKNLLLTFTSVPRQETAGLYQNAVAYMHARERLQDPSSSGALFAWLLFHVERTSRAARELRQCTTLMDEAMDQDINSVHIDEIIEAKDQLLRVLSVAEEQTECLEALARAEADTKALDFSKLRGSMGVLLATTGATERTSVRIEKHLMELRQRHAAHQQHNMNRRLAVLTVLSAVFLPLTLLSGIWGMNFDNMPELQSPDAYPLALLGMFSIASIMIYYFWRTGWLD